MVRSRLSKLLLEIRKCDVCAASLPNAPRPVLTAHRDARILIIGQAPGRRVDESGIPWADPSGERLRDWLGVSSEDFYDEKKFALVPMGFCYPGTGKSGDLPPRPECADLWHERVLAEMPNIQLTVLLSQYALARYLVTSEKGKSAKKTLTETVKAWKEYRPKRLPLPHPSPRNNRWLAKNEWFAVDVLPYLRRRVRTILK